MSNKEVFGDGGHADVDVSDVAVLAIDGGALHARHYRPRRNAPVPTVVDVHGGAWTKGDRLTNARIHGVLAANGIGVFALDFRMPPSAQYPGTVADINHGIRWLKRHADELGVFKPWIGGLGTSSGGHLVTLNALMPRDEAYRHDTGPAVDDASLKYVVNCWPILDPWSRYLMAVEKHRQALVDAHRAFWPSDADMLSGNPLRIVTEGRQQETPPMLLIQGTADDNVDHHGADAFAAAYRQVGGTAMLHKFDGEKHAFLAEEPFSAAGAKALRLMTDFIVAQTVGE